MLRRLVTTTIAIVALTLASDLGAQQQTPSQSATKKANRQRQIICRGAVIPAGWILVDDLRDTSMCGGGNPQYVNSYNVWAIEKFDGAAPGTQLTVCAAAPTPAGWSLVDIYRDKSVCGHPDDVFATNVKVIRRNPAAAPAR